MPALVGEPAPDFSTSRDDGTPFVLSEWRGQWLALFFFPRAATTHCQMQARRFQALLPEFERLGATVVGVSSDDAAGHGSFRSVCRLDFPLLSDHELSASRAFGVVEDEFVDGETTRRARRETFLIDPEGRIVEAWRPADPNRNAADVLAELRQRTSA